MPDTEKDIEAVAAVVDAEIANFGFPAGMGVPPPPGRSARIAERAISAYRASREAQGWVEVRAGPSRPKLFLQWAVDTFGRVALNRNERACRFLEEAVELAQAEGISQEVAAKIIGRVYSREPGATAKEIGQAQATLEVLAQNIGLSSDVEAEREFARVRTIPKHEWDRRHAAKVEAGFALAASGGEMSHMQDSRAIERWNRRAPSPSGLTGAVQQVYADLHRQHLRAARDDFDGPRRSVLFALIEAVRAAYPNETWAWENTTELPRSAPSPSDRAGE